MPRARARAEIHYRTPAILFCYRGFSFGAIFFIENRSKEFSGFLVFLDRFCPKMVVFWVDTSLMGHVYSGLLKEEDSSGLGRAYRVRFNGANHVFGV